MSGYQDIQIGGGDTATPLCLHKRMGFFLRHLPPPPARVLDCGCGAGEYVLRLCADAGFDAHGVEYSADKVARASLAPRLDGRVRQGDLAHLPFETGAFDAALLNEVLEHVPSETSALREIHRVLRLGGVLIVASPNRLFPFETHGVAWRSSGRPIPPWVPFIPWLPLKLGRRFFDYWARNYWPGQLSGLLTQNGFRVVRRSYFWQTFENISGSQPWLIGRFRGVLRSLANLGERLPVVRGLGTSQVLVCERT
jgi:SAM-dependent methyltransferase